MLVSCCPTGVFEDSFGSIYQLATEPHIGNDPFNPTYETSGYVDTGEMGCGVWNIRSPVGTERPPDYRQFDVIWIAENPHPDAADNCCQAFLFKGNSEGDTCNLIFGQYESIGTKCTQSGEMNLLSLLF